MDPRRRALSMVAHAVESEGGLPAPHLGLRQWVSLPALTAGGSDGRGVPAADRLAAPSPTPRTARRARVRVAERALEISGGHRAQSGRARSRAKNLRGARFAPWTGPGRVSRLAVELWQSPASTRRRYWNDDERCSSPSPASSGVASLRASSAAPVYRAARSWSVVATISWRRVIRRSSSISE